MKKSYKILSIIVLIILALAFSSVVSNAATTTISGGQNVTEGDSVTVKASVTAGAWNLVFSGAEKTEELVGQTSQKDNMSDSVSITFKATKVGTYTFTLTGDVTDYHTDETTDVNKTYTVEVKAKSTSTSGSSSNSSGSSSDSNSTSSSGNSSSSGSSSKDTTKQPTFTSKKETVYAKDDGIRIRASYSTSSDILGSLNKGDSITRTGVGDNGWSKVTYNGQTAYISTSLLTTTKPQVKVEEEKPEETDEQEDDEKEENENQEKSDNTNLKSLEVTPTGLSPAFSNVTTEYTMTVDSEVDKIEVKAVAEDEKAKVSISGNDDLEVGTNTIKIKVTAEDGTERTYVITVTKEEKEQLKLSEILIEGLPLKPEFDENVYEYTIDLDKSDISELNITAKPSKKSAEVEIVGNTELKPGENVITILVKSSDGEEITTYQITANLPEMVQDIATAENDNLYKYIGIGAAVVVLIIIVIVVVRKSRKNDDDEFVDYSDLYNKRKKQEQEVEVNNNLEESQKEISIDELPKLDNEDLPKSLRKEKVEIEQNEENPAEKENSKGNEKVQEEESDRSKKIDELYAMSADGDSKRKRGKHF